MNKQDQVWLWITAAVSVIMGATLVLNDSSAGWFLIILGIAYLGASTGAAQKWATSKLNLARWGLIGVLVLAILLVVGTVAVIVL